MVELVAFVKSRKAIGRPLKKVYVNANKVKWSEYSKLQHVLEEHKHLYSRIQTGQIPREVDGILNDKD